MATDLSIDNIDVFDQRDALDKAVEAYEDVPLLAQIGIGLTPPGLAIDAAETAKYGRDAISDFGEGEIKSGLINTGIAGLSALGAIPIVGDILKRYGKKGLKAFDSPGDEIADLQKKLDDPNIKDEDLLEHPAFIRAEKENMKYPSTSDMDGFGSQQWIDTRPINIINKEGRNVTRAGYDRAIKNQFRISGELPYTDAGLKVPENLVIKNERKAVILIGPPAAGKSTIANPIARFLNARIVDPDEAKKVFPESMGGIANNATHVESKVISSAVAQKVAERGDNVLLPTIGHNQAKIDKMAKNLKEKGYNVDLVNVSVSPENATTRMLSRFVQTGKQIPKNYFLEVIQKPDIVYETLKRSKNIDGYAKIDNNTGLDEIKDVLEDTTSIFRNQGSAARSSDIFRNVSQDGRPGRKTGGPIYRESDVSGISKDSKSGLEKF